MAKDKNSTKVGQCFSLNGRREFVKFPPQQDFPCEKDSIGKSPSWRNGGRAGSEGGSDVMQ